MNLFGWFLTIVLAVFLFHGDPNVYDLLRGFLVRILIQ